MLFPQLQQQLAEILPGFRSGISQQHEGGCLPKIAFKCILLKAALIYSSLKWMCLPEQKQLSLSTSFSVTFSLSPPLLSLSCAPLHSVTHFIPIFTSISAGPAAINCVPDWDHREKCGWECWVYARERQGKAGHSSLQGRKSLSHIAAHIHPPE